MSHFSRRSRTDIIASQFVEIRFAGVMERTRVRSTRAALALLYERHVLELGFWHTPPDGTGRIVMRPAPYKPRLPRQSYSRSPLFFFFLSSSSSSLLPFLLSFRLCFSSIAYERTGDDPVTRASFSAVRSTTDSS